MFFFLGTEVGSWRELSLFEATTFVENKFADPPGEVSAKLLHVTPSVYLGCSWHHQSVKKLLILKSALGR